MTAHKAFLGDGEKTFALTPALVAELERKTGAGIGALARRIFGGEFFVADLAEIIRLALIGGGTSPEDAFVLVRLYVEPRPLLEILPLAVSILECLMFGKTNVDPTEPTTTDIPAGEFA